MILCRYGSRHDDNPVRFICRPLGGQGALACTFFARIYHHAIRTGVLARYTAETLSEINGRRCDASSLPRLSS